MSIKIVRAPNEEGLKRTLDINGICYKILNKSMIEIHMDFQSYSFNKQDIVAKVLFTEKDYINWKKERLNNIISNMY